jgi:hypothetical protein
LDDSRAAQYESDVLERKDAMNHQRPAVLMELEAFSDQETSVLPFEHLRSDGTTRVTIQTRDFSSLERSLARVRRVAVVRHQLRIVSTSRDMTTTLIRCTQS